MDERRPWCRVVLYGPEWTWKGTFSWGGGDGNSANVFTRRECYIWDSLITFTLELALSLMKAQLAVIFRHQDTPDRVGPNPNPGGRG